MSKQNKKTKYAPVGGQALIEGVMMNGPAGAALAVRMPDGSISTEMRPFKRIRDKHKIFGLPFIRGIVNMVESQVFGYKCLMDSAERSTGEMTEEEEPSKFDLWVEKHLGNKLMPILGAISGVIGVALAVGLFFFLPIWCYRGINSLVSVDLHSFQALIEGAMRIVIFVAYLVLVSRMKEIKRVFMYHGAEHKSIFCLESGLPLTVENVRIQGRFHPRCGTSFLFLTILLSILVSAITLARFPVLHEMSVLWFFVKILLLPIIVGLGYECIMLAGKYQNWLTRTLTAPGLWMQRITTNEPDDEMIEVALAALNAALGREEPSLVPIDEEDAATQAEKPPHELPPQEDEEPVLTPKKEPEGGIPAPANGATPS